MKTFTAIAVSLLFVITTLTVNAQSTEQIFKKEVGIRLYGLNDINLMYKKQLEENKFRRVRLIDLQLYVQDFEETNGSFTFGSAIGSEKRKPLNDKLSLIRGTEFISRLNSTLVEDDLDLLITLGIGFVLGFQYDINNKFYVNLETIPSLSTDFRFNDSDDAIINNFRFGYNTQLAALGFMYRF